jgi:phage shock protein C
MIGGVAAGIANYVGIDVTIVRLIWVLLLLPGGLPGLVPYLILWIIMPAER